jgi:hypothetical protein
VRSAAVLRCAVAGLVLLAFLSAGACGSSSSGSAVVTGSGGQATKSYDYSGFTSVRVDQGFSATLKQGGKAKVSVTVNQNLVKYLKVEVQGDTLHIGLDPSKKYLLTNLTADVTLPALKSLEVTGASDAFAEGFSSNDALVLTVSGHSQLNLSAISAASASFDVSGAGKLGGKLTLAGDLHAIASGAGQALLAGTAKTVHVEASGGSSISLRGLRAEDADVNLSGASQASVNASGTINLQASGASVMDYYGSATLGSVDVSGASQINHIK